MVLFLCCLYFSIRGILERRATRTGACRLPPSWAPAGLRVSAPVARGILGQLEYPPSRERYLPRRNYHGGLLGRLENPPIRYRRCRTAWCGTTAAWRCRVRAAYFRQAVREHAPVLHRTRRAPTIVPSRFVCTPEELEPWVRIARQASRPSWCRLRPVYTPRRRRPPVFVRPAHPI